MFNFSNFGNYRGIEQSVARWAHNPKVAGSSPAPATIKAEWLYYLRIAIFLIIPFVFYAMSNSTSWIFHISKISLNLSDVFTFK